jgi:hypothetical protein
MRIRLTRRPPTSYEVNRDLLRIGEVYNLPSELAAALILEGCAELADNLAADRKRRFPQSGFTSTEASDQPTLLIRRKPPRLPK